MALAPSPAVASLSPAGQALGFGAGTNAESEEQRRKRLAALQAAQQGIRAGLGASALSPAGSSLLASGGFGFTQ
jgi:hypothetical protein